MENFGGSQDNLHFLGRNPDKEPAVHILRKNSLNKITNPPFQENISTGVQNLLQNSNTSPSNSISNHWLFKSYLYNLIFIFLAMSRVSSDVSNNSFGLQRMLYDSFDDIESSVQSPVHTLKRSLSYVDTTQSVFTPSTTTWYQQSCSSPAHSEQGLNHNFIFTFLFLIELNF